MKLDLDKTGLTSLVCGISPNFSLFENALVKRCGAYNGSYGTWSWDDDELEKLTEHQLYDLYLLCKNSYT